MQTEKLKAVATLASGLAHEIKNPLTALRTFSEYLPGRLDDKDFLRTFAPIIQREVDRINTLVHELLDFAKPTPVNLKLTSINPLLDNILEFLSLDLVKHKIQLIKGYGSTSDVRLRLDASQFKQALLNILLNSIEAMPKGGELRITTVRSGDLVKLIIADSGCGIRKKDLPHIFDPFYTAKPTGTGLGLSITKRIVEQHGGEIFVESTQGQGTEFSITLKL